MLDHGLNIYQFSWGAQNPKLFNLNLNKNPNYLIKKKKLINKALLVC
jgi:hypothetical protein